MHRIISFVLNMFRRLYTTMHFYLGEKPPRYERIGLSSLFFSPKSLTYKGSDSYIYSLQIFCFGVHKICVCLPQEEARSGLFTHPHGLHFFYPSVRWFVRDLHLPTTACGKLHFPGSFFLILWFIKSLALPRDSNISGSD